MRSRYACKQCGAESPRGIGYPVGLGRRLPKPVPTCPGPHRPTPRYHDRVVLKRVWIQYYKRLSNSVNGNPRYDVTFTDGTGKLWTYRTSSDSMVNYEIENVYRDCTLVDVVVTKATRIVELRRK